MTRNALTHIRVIRVHNLTACRCYLYPKGLCLFCQRCLQCLPKGATRTKGAKSP